MNIEIWLFAAAVLWVPGAAIARFALPSRDVVGGATRITAELAFGMAFWPLAFLWMSFVPLHWSSSVVRGLVICAAAIAFFRKPRIRFVRPVTLGAALLPLILVATAWTRVRAIWGIVLPPWVDSVHHAMLLRLFLMRGTLPETYDPFVSGATAFYHWGFHAIAAAVAWFAGRTDPFSAASVMLSLGQFLNGLTPLFVYAASRALLRSRTAAIIAAALAGLVSYYPAYYVSWGRYTHLAGTLLLLAWIALASRARRLSPGSVASLAIVAAGLALVHVRLAFFAVTFTIVFIVMMRRRRTIATLLAAGAVAAVLVAPWFVQLRTIAPKVLLPSESDTRWRTPAEVRENLLWVPHAAELLSVATAGLSGMANVGPLSTAARVASFVWWLALVVVAVATRRRFRTRPLVILAAWCALTLLVLNGTRVQFATNTSAAITAFVPVSMAAGWIVAWLIAPMRRVALPVIVVICAAIGIATLSNVINPGTVIADASDVAALEWIRASLPPSATIVGRVRSWYGGTFIGADGAYWSSVLTDRRSLPPPTLYGWSGSNTSEIDLFLARWQAEYPTISPSTLTEARRLGVTHIYYGRGVEPSGNIVYQRDGIAIGTLNPAGV